MRVIESREGSTPIGSGVTGELKPQAATLEPEH